MGRASSRRPGTAQPLEHALASVFPVQLGLNESEDHVERTKAFAEKRKPRWKGRWRAAPSFLIRRTWKIVPP